MKETADSKPDQYTCRKRIKDEKDASLFAERRVDCALFPGRISEVFLESARKSRIIPKTTFIADVGNRFSLKDEIPGKKQAFGGKIISNRIAGFFLERVHQMISTQKESFRERVDGDVFGKMFVQIINDSNHFLIG